jgi:hypothetical protein
MIGREQLTTIAATVADEFANRPARWDRLTDSGEPIGLQHEINWCGNRCGHG